MSSNATKLWEIYEGLKNRFLFNNDINSIYMLLSLYDLEENISNIYPKYICLNNIKRRIKNVLTERNDKEKIAMNISYLIHEDINRIELCFYLEGYKYGYYNNKYVNILEERALNLLSYEEMYNKRYLFHYNFTDVKDIKIKLKNEIDKIERNDKEIERLVFTFCNKVIKKKINNLDKYINKQLILDFSPYDFKIIDENYELNEYEVDKIYHGIVNLLIKNLKRIYKDASWFALNDKVLKRYL